MEEGREQGRKGTVGKGRKICESTKTTNKKLAEKMYAKRITETADGKFFANEARKRTFEELRERYMAEHSKVHKTEKSSIRDECSFKHLSRAFGGFTLATITSSRVSDYKSLRMKEGAKPATLSKELELLRHALNLALQWEWIETNPSPKNHQRTFSYIPPYRAIQPVCGRSLFGLKRGAFVG